MNRQSHSSKIVLMAVVATCASWATADTYTLDPVHSVALFRVKHANVGFTYGRFNECSGTVAFNPEDMSESRVEVAIKTESVDTANEDRDKHLRSADFLDVENHPLMSFKSTGFKKVAKDTYEVTGDFTLHGETKSITIKVEHTGAGPGMHGETRIGFEAMFAVKRSEYGMTNMIGPVGDDIGIIISFEGVKQ